MSKKESIARYSADEIQSTIARGESKTDWAKTGAVSQQEVEAGIAADADESGLQFDWSKASPVLPEPKAILHMRVDRDVLEFFRKQGRGYQTTINAVLRFEQLSAHTRAECRRAVLIPAALTRNPSVLASEAKQSSASVW